MPARIASDASTKYDTQPESSRERVAGRAADVVGNEHRSTHSRAAG